LLVGPVYIAVPIAAYLLIYPQKWQTILIIRIIGYIYGKNPNNNEAIFCNTLARFWDLKYEATNHRKNGLFAWVWRTLEVIQKRFIKNKR